MYLNEPDDMVAVSIRRGDNLKKNVENVCMNLVCV